MKIERLFKIFMPLVLMLTVGCAFSHRSQNAQDKLKIEIIKGRTTETAILNSLGVPNSTSTDGVGNEVWNYQKIAYFTAQGNNPSSLTFWEVSTGNPSENTDPFDLVITFDQNDVVKDFQIVLTTP